MGYYYNMSRNFPESGFSFFLYKSSKVQQQFNPFCWKLAHIFYFARNVLILGCNGLFVELEYSTICRSWLDQRR